METQPDLEIQKTPTSKAETDKAETEERQVHQAKRGSSAYQQMVPVEQAQVQLALRAIQRNREARAEKINALRAQIEAGTYQIDSASLAMKLLGITEQDAK